jgi:predicted RNase H-like nuclease (RuvC/YqgF family)
MVRKRIGDLLREEVNEPVATEEDAANEAQTNHTKEEKEELPPETISQSATELEANINELKKLLQAAQKKETSLQSQVTDLKSQLQEQKKLVKELQTQASQEKQLKIELEEAKKTILKLAEVSSKPVAKATPAKQESKLTPAKSTRAEKLPHYSDPSERPNTTLANKDIGWFD